MQIILYRPHIVDGRKKCALVLDDGEQVMLINMIDTYDVEERTMPDYSQVEYETRYFRNPEFIDRNEVEFSNKKPAFINENEIPF